MKTTINILKSIGIGLLVFLFFYLAGSFGNASLNINSWGESRTVVSGFGLLFFIGFSVGTFIYLNDK